MSKTFTHLKLYDKRDDFNFHTVNFPFFHIVNFPFFHIVNFPFFHIVNFPFFHIVNFPFFHIVNFPFILSSDRPSGPSCSVYISQLVRHTRCCTYYDDFGYRHKLLVARLLSHGYRINRLGNSFQKCYSMYPDVVAKYQKSARDMMNDSFPLLLQQTYAVKVLLIFLIYKIFVTWSITLTPP